MARVKIFSIPKYRFIGYTALVETDDVFQREWGIRLVRDAAGAVTNWDEVLRTVRTKCETVYGTDAAGDLTDSDNAVNRFVAYHLISGKMAYDKLIRHYNEFGYQFGNNKEPQTFNCPTNVWDYYTTMGKHRGLVKITQVGDAGFEHDMEHRIYVNRISEYDNSRQGDYREPAAFANVMAPVLFSDNAKIVRSVATADENYIQGTSFNNAPFKQYYSTFMKAMQSRFSFFVPTDEALGSYGLVDPMSLARSATGFHRYWRLEYANRNNPPVTVRATAFWFDETAGSRPEDTRKPSGTTYANVSEPSQSLTNGAGLVKKKLLLEMMDQHIIVHDSSDEQGMTGPARYYMSRGGAPVLVKSKGDASNNNVGMVVNGGFQVQLNSDGYPDNDHDCVVTEGYDQTGGVADGVKGYGNGMTYFLDRPMQPTTRSVYNVLGGDEEHFSEFFELCNISFSEDLLKLAGFKKQIVVNAAEGTMRDMTPDEWSAEQDKYRIFTNASGYNPAEDEKLVRFFNNYRYTVYVPTNAAIEEARAKGLPMYDDILRFIEDNTVMTDGVDALSPENQLKAQAMITMLVNFVKYHFQDQSFFVDNVSSEGRYQTFCADNERNAFLDLTMRQTPGAITVTDGAGVTQNVVAPYNIMARDANFDRPPSSTATDISNSSYVVIHQVGKVLNFAPLEGGRYDGAWTTVKKARDFVRRYAVR